MGVNVAKQVGGELVSFLVPAHFAADLVKRVLADVTAGFPRRDRCATREAAKRIQVLAGRWIQKLYRSDYIAYPKPARRGFTCWARNTNLIGQNRAPTWDRSIARASGLFVANDLSVGGVQFGHAYARSIDLNAFQFATFMAQQVSVPTVCGGTYRKWYARDCREDFMAAKGDSRHPPLHGSSGARSCIANSRGCTTSPSPRSRRIKARRGARLASSRH